MIQAPNAEPGMRTKALRTIPIRIPKFPIPS